MTFLQSKMKYSILLALLLYSFMILQICAWKPFYPITNVKLGLSNRPQRSLFGKSPANRQLQTYLNPEKSLQRPNIRQRTIRDLMTRLVANNQRIPMMSASSYNRASAQQGIPRPSPNQNMRGTTSQRYRQVMNLPSSPALHSLENTRTQHMVVREPALRKTNLPPVLRPQPMLQQSLVSQSMRKPGMNGVQRMPMSSVIHSSRPHTMASLNSAIADILNSPSINSRRHRNAPRKVEVVHHIPVAANPSKLKTSSPAVVYISKPKNNMQHPQSMFMRDVPETPHLSSSQSQKTHKLPFDIREPDSILSDGNRLNQELNHFQKGFRGPQYPPSDSKSLRQPIQGSYLMPTTRLQGQFQDHRNSGFPRVVKNIPQSQVMRVVPANANTKQVIPSSIAQHMTSTRGNAPRINRLKQELNSEIQQLLKLVPQSPAIATKKPKIAFQRQIPHPFSMPSPSYENTSGTNSQVKSSLNSEVNKNIANAHIIKSNPEFEMRQPHFPKRKNINEQFLKLQTLKSLPPPASDSFSINQRRPVVTETSLDSEELSELLESMGYDGDRKHIHNTARIKPVKLIIPGDRDMKKQVSSFSQSERFSPLLNKEPSHHDEKFHPSHSKDLPYPHEMNLPFSHIENSQNSYSESLPPNHDENSPNSSKNSPPSESENSPYSFGEHFYPSQSGDSLSHGEVSPFSHQQHSPPSQSEDSSPNNEQFSHSQSESLHPLTENLPSHNKQLFSHSGQLLSHSEHLLSHSADLPSPIEHLPSSYNEDLPISENGFLHSSINEDLSPSQSEYLPPSENEDLSPHKTEELPPSDDGSSISLSTGELSTPKDEDIPTKSEDSVSPNKPTLPGNSMENQNVPVYIKPSENYEFLSNVEDSPSNKSSAMKTYWDIKDLISGLETLETTSQKTAETEKESEISHGVNNYQGEESIASISVKEEFPQEEEIRKKYSKDESPWPSSGSLHDIYNKKIHDERKENIPTLHIVRNFPQHLVPHEGEIVSTPKPENKVITPTITTEIHKHELSKNSELSHVSLKKVPNFVRPPKERVRHMHPTFNVRERPAPIHRPVSIKISEHPKYIRPNENINIDPNQRTTPSYFITKAPHRLHFGQRNRPKNENSLVPKFSPQERPQFNQENPIQLLGPFNHPVNPPDYITPETFIQHPSSPEFMNFRPFRTFTSRTPEPSQSNIDKLRKPQLETEKESHYKSMIMTTTEIPEKVTDNHNFELNTAESQVENFQKAENIESESELPQVPETIAIPNKQFFRGPQHSIEYDGTTFNLQETTTDFVPYSSLETLSVTTAMTDIPTTEDSMPYNETGGVRQYSVHSQTKVINALHLANKVFGRRNHTSFKQSITTTKIPQVKHKFTYAAVIKPSTKPPMDYSESTNPGSKLVFNFRTGTTQSLPPQARSAVPKIIPVNRNKLLTKSKNDSLDFIPVLKQNDPVIISPKNSTKTSLFQHIVFSQPNISSKLPQNESFATDSSKDLYGILKPATKPYNGSLTSVDENDVKRLTTKIYRIRITSTTVKPIDSSATEQSESTERTVSTPDSKEYLSTIIESDQDVSKDDLFGENSESTEPFAFTTMAEIQTEITAKDEDSNTALDLETNTTTVPVSKETTTEPINQEQLVVDSLKSMKLKMQEMASKGLRHLMPLVMELSSDVSISSDCTFSLLRWLRAVRTMEQWAVRMMDASSKMPEGILYGTFSTFGSYDECIGIKTPKANLQMPYSGQYCSINIQPILPPRERHFTIQNAFRKYPKLKQVFHEMNIEEDTMAYYYILKHRIGLCMPSTCSMEDLGNVTEKLADQLKMKISVERCETSEKPSLSKGQVISMTGVIIAFGIVLLATIFDISIRVRSDHEMDIEEIIRKKNGLRQFSFVFSAYGNARKILNCSIPTTHLSSLHGIKFLSISWVMLGHVYYCKDYLTLAGLNKVRDLGSNLAFQVVLNSAFAADTFFFLSGLLVVYSTFLYMENNNGRFTIVGFYIRRYWRLTPAFLMISGVILLGPLAGSGPIWHETLQPFVSGCENYWWTNLFYFSNFVPTNKTCVPHGWFLSCDMQFYIVAPIIILALYRRPKLGILLIILGIMSSMITTGFLTFLYNLPPVSLFSLPDPKDINEYLDTVGYKPYAHYASYCVGMATGFLLAAKQKISLSRCLQTFGWVVSIIMCCLVIYGTWNWNSGELPSWPVSVAYATTSRTIWCLGVAWITVVCYAGHGGPINSILSWHGFIPLSRLSYLAYLIHPLLMYLYASYVRSPFYFSQYVVVYLYLGHLCVTFGLAFLFSLAFEVPFLNMEKLITMYLDKNKRKRRASFSNHHNNWQHPEHPELKDSVVLMRRRADKFLS